MSELHIPSIETRKWTQPNMGDLLGTLWASFNLDLTLRPGKVNISHPTYLAYSTTDDAQMVNPVAGIRTAADSTDRWWYLADTVLFKSDSAVPTSGIAQDAIASTPTDLSHLLSDMVEHEGSLIVSKSTDLYKLTAGTWTATWWTGAGNLNQAALVSTKPHPMDVFNRVLMIADGNYLHTVDRNSLVANRRLTLPPEFEIRWIRHNVDRVWIGAKNIYGRSAEVFEWDGYTETYLRRHTLVGDITFAATIKNGVPYTITNAGVLMKHNGSTFSVEARLPVFQEDILEDASSGNQTAGWADAYTSQQMVHFNGMTVIADKVHILLAGDINGNSTYQLENMRSGIWCYDEEVGLYHRYGLSKYQSGTKKDYATSIIERAGFLAPINKRYGKFICGAKLATNQSSGVISGIFTNTVVSSLTKRGYFITTKIQTSQVREEWEKIWGKFRKFRASTNGIMIKVRSSDKTDYSYPFVASIKWSGTTGLTFLTSETGFANADVGDEVEFILGDGAGASSHIATIGAGSGGFTYLITLSESIGTTTNDITGIARVTNFRLLDTFGSTTTTLDQKSISENSTWVQFKVELKGQYDMPELEELLVFTQNNIKIQD